MKKFQSNYGALAHHWVHDNDGIKGECYGDRMFSEYDRIYSYGYHYTMGRKIRDKKGRVIFIALNGHSSTNTTMKQMRVLRSSIPVYIPTIDLPDANPYQFEDCIEYFKHSYEYFCVKISKAKSKKEYYINEANIVINNFSNYLKLCKLAKIKVYKRKIGKYWLDLLKNGVTEQDTVKLADQKAKEEKAIARKRALANKKLHKNELDKLSKWKSYEDTNRSIYLSTISEAHLRIVEDKVQTTGGVEVSVKGAKVLARKIDRGDDVKGYELEGYTVISLNGTLKIGCHSIDRGEVDRVVKELLEI